MTKALRTAVACALLLVGGSAGLAGQTTDDGAVVLAEEMASLRMAIVELHDLMTSMVEQQQAMLDQQAMDLALRRMAMAREELAPIRKDLRAAENERQQALEEEVLLKAEVERVNRQLSEAVSAGDDEQTRQLQTMLDRVAIPLEMAADRVWRLDQRIIELEQELETRSEALVELSQAIDQWLGFN